MQHKFLKLLLLTSLVFVITGCHTTGNFKVPEGSTLYLGNRPNPITVPADGKVETRPYFWSYTKGIPYRLEKDGKVIQEGKVKSRFRVASIFWPPYAIIYWPIGFNHVMNDLTAIPPKQ